MAITTSDNLKNGTRGEYCSVCKERKLLLRMGVTGLICTDCDPHASDSPIRLASAPGAAPEAESEAKPEA